jgi:hypothetical protein
MALSQASATALSRQTLGIDLLSHEGWQGVVVRFAYGQWHTVGLLLWSL